LAALAPWSINLAPREGRRIMEERSVRDGEETEMEKGKERSIGR